MTSPRKPIQKSCCWVLTIYLFQLEQRTKFFYKGYYMLRLQSLQVKICLKLKLFMVCYGKKGKKLAIKFQKQYLVLEETGSFNSRLRMRLTLHGPVCKLRQRIFKTLEPIFSVIKDTFLW
jgi:hypothetical protein